MDTSTACAGRYRGLLVKLFVTDDTVEEAVDVLEDHQDGILTLPIAQMAAKRENVLVERLVWSLLEDVVDASTLVQH